MLLVALHAIRPQTFLALQLSLRNKTKLLLGTSKHTETAQTAMHYLAEDAEEQM
jgi:hypothetical protein